MLRKFEYGAEWTLIFYHDSSNGDWFDEETALDYYNKEENFYQFSIIGQVKNRFKSPNNNYEYLLEYPECNGSKYNRWIQSIDIASTDSNQTSEDIGYIPINIDFPNHDFGGIARS